MTELMESLLRLMEYDRFHDRFRVDGCVIKCSQCGVHFAITTPGCIDAMLTPSKHPCVVKDNPATTYR